MKRTTILLLLLWAIVTIAYGFLRYHTFIGALAHDDGLFLYGGQAWAAGEIPFHNFWDHKAPGIFFFHSIPLRLFPFSLVAVKSFQILCLSICAVLLFVLCRRFVSIPASLITVAAFVFYTSLRYTVRSGGLTEEDALLFIVLYLLMVLTKDKLTLKSVFWGGVFLGIAFQFRQTYIVAMALGLWSIGRAFLPWRDTRECLRYTATLVAGILAPEIVISFYFLIHGCWGEYIEASYLFNFYYIGPGRPGQPWADVWNLHWKFILSTGPYLLAPALALSVFYWIRKEVRWLVWPLLIVFSGDMVSASLSGEFYEHYYVQATVSTCLLLTLFFDGVYIAIRQSWQTGIIRFKSISVLVFLAVLCVICCYPFYTAVNRFAADYRTIYDNLEREASPVMMQRGVANAVRRLTGPDDRILLIGRDPNSVYFLSGRYAAARYYHFAPLWKEKLFQRTRPRHIRFFMHDLCKNKPLLLLIDQKPQRGQDEQGLDRWSKFVIDIIPYIDNDYVPLDEVLDEIPEDEWFWYDSWLGILVRSDRAEDVKRNFERSVPK